MAKAPSKDSIAGLGDKFTREEYNQVARSARLVGVSLLKENFDLNLDYFDDEVDRTKDRLGFGVTSAFRIDEEGESIATSVWDWSVKVRRGRRVLVKINATYIAAYTDVKNCNEHAVHAFVERVGKFTTFPYFRARVGGISQDADIHLPILPVISN